MTEEPYLEIYRPSASVRRQLTSMFVIISVAGYFWYSYLYDTGWTYDLVCGTLFSLWGLYIIFSLVARRLLFRETADGFVAFGAFRYHSIRWDQLIGLCDVDVSKITLMVVWRKSPDDKKRYFAISKRGLGPENVVRVTALIRTRCPELPILSREDVQRR